ncbi:MAG: RNA polymerase sigma factor [Candidatus Xenobia bacterium]
MNPDALQPDALVRAIQDALAGQQLAEAKNAFARLFEAMQPKMCQWAACWLERCYLPRQEYHDVVQHVMEEFWRHLVTHQPVKSVGGWLRKAIESTVLDRRKYTRRRPLTGSLEELAERAIVDVEALIASPDPAEVVLDHLFLDQAIAALPDPEWRQVMELFRAGYRLSDIARRLPLGTERVKRCHRSALDWLRRRVDQKGEAPTR